MISNYSLTKMMTGPLTWEKFLECLTFLNTYDVDPECRVMVVGPDQLVEALNIRDLNAQQLPETLIGCGRCSKRHESKYGFACGFHWILDRSLPPNTFYVCSFEGETK